MYYLKQQLPGITFETHTVYKEVLASWQNIVNESHHLLSPDIEALEASKPEDIEFRYVNIIENGELIGIMYLQCLMFNQKHYDHSLFDRPVLKYIKGFAVRQKTYVLVCGNLFRVNFQGFYFKDKSRRDLIFNCLLNYKESVHKQKNFSGILVKDCSREFNQIQFGCHSFRSFTQDLTMELDIQDKWATFTDYTSALSRKYRQRASKIQTSLKDIHVLDLSLEDLSRYKDKINQLYLNIVRQQSLALGILNADYFARMKAALGDKFKVFAYFRQDNMLAFSSHIYYPEKQYMEIHYIGLDYEANPKHQLYFNILFDGIKTAIEKKLLKIEMGRTAREAKASAGAHPVENFNYIWIKPGFARLVVNFLSKWFESKIGDEWQKRHPFKSDPKSEEVQG